jgi:hypothetical protein
VRTPTARAHGIEELQIVVDAHEQYPYRFATQNATTVRRALPCGDYGLDLNGQLVGQTFSSLAAGSAARPTSGCRC